MLTVDIQGLRDLRGRFAKMLDEELLAIQLEEAEAMAKVIQDNYRHHAPRSQKTSSDDGIHFFETIVGRAVATETGFSVEVSTSKPDLRRWLAEGTGEYGPRHQRIVPVTPGVMALGPIRSWSPAGQGGPLFFRSVAGMEANPWERDALAETLPLARELGNRIGRRVTMRLAGL